MTTYTPNPALRAGTPVEIRGLSLDMHETWEPAVICRWIASRSGPREAMPDWYCIRFGKDGARLLCHTSHIRLV